MRTTAPTYTGIIRRPSVPSAKKMPPVSRAFGRTNVTYGQSRGVSRNGPKRERSTMTGSTLTTSTPNPMLEKTRSTKISAPRKRPVR